MPEEPRVGRWPRRGRAGALLRRGRGTALGALLGTLIIALIENGIVTFSNNREYRLGIIGAAILLAVALERVSASRRT